MRLAVMILLAGILVSCYGPPRHDETPVSFTSDDIDSTLRTDYPNPFSPTTQIVIAVDTCSSVSIDLYNVLGEVLGSVADTVICEQTEFSFDDFVSYESLPDGQVRMVHPMEHAPAGVYFYRARIGDKTYTRKIVLLK